MNICSIAFEQVQSHHSALLNQLHSRGQNRYDQYPSAGFRLEGFPGLGGLIPALENAAIGDVDPRLGIAVEEPWEGGAVSPHPAHFLVPEPKRSCRIFNWEDPPK